MTVSNVLINLSLSALLDNGDEVLVPSPDYPLWTACVNLAGGTAVHYVCDEDSEWYPDIDDMRSKITDKTKAIVIINPNNPTGALYPKEVLQQIVDLAREHQLMIFSDEIYDRLVMDGLEHISIASLAPDLFCVTFSGLSKSHMIAGWRVGWMVLSGNKRLAKDYIEGLNMLANMRMCSNVPAQSVVQTALGGHQSVKDYLVPGGRIYDQRELVYNMLNDIPGITAVKPKAAFYIFPKIVHLRHADGVETLHLRKAELLKTLHVRCRAHQPPRLCRTFPRSSCTQRMTARASAVTSTALNPPSQFEQLLHKPLSCCAADSSPK